jgi:hypothetical protein
MAPEKVTETASTVWVHGTLVSVGGRVEMSVGGRVEMSVGGGVEMSVGGRVEMSVGGRVEMSVLPPGCRPFYGALSSL